MREDREDGATRGRSLKNADTNSSFRERGSRAINGTAAAEGTKVCLTFWAAALV